MALIDLFWLIMTRMIDLIIPVIGILLCFDFIGSLIFNKR